MTNSQSDWKLPSPLPYERALEEEDDDLETCPHPSSVAIASELTLSAFFRTANSSSTSITSNDLYHRFESIEIKNETTSNPIRAL